MRLTPREFFALTPAQLDELRDGYEWREREEWTRLAWMTANLMNASGRLKRPVRIADLLPAKLKPKPPSLEDWQRELAEKQKRFEAAQARRRQMKLAQGSAQTTTNELDRRRHG